MSQGYLFKNVDVRECPEGKQIRKIIRDNWKSLPKCKSSYKTANGTYLEVSFGEGKLADECTIRFFYKSWHWVNIHFHKDGR